MRVLILLFACLFLYKAQAQELRLDSISKIVQNTYEHRPDGSRFLTVLKESHFDTNQLLILQHRRSFIPSDTGAFLSNYYFYEYRPSTKLGNYFHERFANPKNPKSVYSKQISQFKNISNHKDNEWLKVLNDKEETAVYSQYTYNSQNFLVESRTEDRVSKIAHTESIERNSANQITTWRSYDEENGQRKQVREVLMTYLFDTMLLTNKGYIYNNYTETVNKYDKKNQLVSSKTQTGYRQDNGKIIFNSKTISKYKNGKLLSSAVTEKGKKVSNSTFTHADNLTQETLTTYEGKTKNTVVLGKASTYDGQKQLTYTESENGKVRLAKEWIYTAGRIQQYIEVEIKTSGNEWKTVIDYNENGNPTRKTFTINNQLKQEDTYEYFYRG